MDVLKEVKVVASRAKSLEELYKNGENWVAKLFEIGLFKKGDRVLDFGAGVGRVSIPLKKRGCKVTAVERRPDMVTMLKEAGIKVVESSSMPEKGTFDSILAAYVFQHQGKNKVKKLIADASKLSSCLYFTIPTFEFWKGNPPYHLRGVESSDEQFDLCEESFVYYEEELWELLEGSQFTHLKKIDLPGDSMYMASYV